MSSFEVMYGRKCIFSIIWENPMDRITLGPEFLKEMEQAMVNIRKNTKVAHDRKQSYENIKRTHREFKVGDHVYLQVKPKISSMRMGMCAKLAPRYCGPFEVLERIGPVAYKLALQPIVKYHNVFHVSLFKKYVHHSNHVIYWNLIQVELEGEFFLEPQCILDRRETML
jgi:ribosomal protein L21E